MKTLKEALFSRKHLNSGNPYGLTEADLKGDIEGFPMGVVVRMLEEQEEQGNKPNVKVFQKISDSAKPGGGFNWHETEAGHRFWENVINHKDFDRLFEKYPEYAKYNLQ